MQAYHLSYNSLKSLIFLWDLNIFENINLFLNSLKVGAFMPQITADIYAPVGSWNCVCMQCHQ